MKKTAVVLFIFNVFCAYSLNIVFFPVNIDKSEESGVIQRYIDEAKNLCPMNLYAHRLSFFTIPVSEEPIKLDSYGRVNYKVRDLENIAENSKPRPYVSIFVINSEKSIGIGGNIGENKLKVIIISKVSKKGTLSHELGHALFELGDEYGGEFSIKFSDAYASKYLNLSKNKPFELWEDIREITGDEKIGYYPGGAGFSGDLYHSYPVCLMGDLKGVFCPVCLYLAVRKLNLITGENLDFTKVYKGNLNCQ
ncbi:MAG TPA: hypothetical protein PLG34_03275 [Spirochaetota bacterium]|jgi:hypothetical protein|nr:MAG: IgA Peptidase M64 [Spirochaetes bacterium ADurb.Bin133]HNZ26469.1 hypothetical protein [Spirochaetota bacterium]HPY86984.1 hypothetical protein [Spirochaetota bacterium]HQB61933.1 hypothetical protein [Spirochaetota bacterium]